MLEIVRVLLNYPAKEKYYLIRRPDLPPASVCDQWQKGSGKGDMSFSFGFSGDDIEIDEHGEEQDTGGHRAFRGSIAENGNLKTNIVAPKRHTLEELVS